MAFYFWRRDGLFHDPFWVRLNTSIKTQAVSPQAFLFSGERDYFMIPFGGGYIKKKCRGFAPHHFSLLSLWKINFPRSINEKCPIKGHLIFWRRERDSNPRTCDSQRFSRPPHSTALPSLRRESKTSDSIKEKIIKKSRNSSQIGLINFVLHEGSEKSEPIFLEIP